MKRAFIVLTVLMLGISLFYPQEAPVKTGPAGYDEFFKANINKEVTVTILYNDINVTGNLIKIYEDGIVIESVFARQFIPKGSIAYAKAKKEAVKK